MVLECSCWHCVRLIVNHHHTWKNDGCKCNERTSLWGKWGFLGRKRMQSLPVERKGTYLGRLYKGRRIWTGQISGTEVCLPESGACRTLWATVGHAAQQERQMKFPMKAINKYLGTHYLCVLWPHDSVEVKHVSYFPSRPPPSLPQSQPITSNLSAAKSRWLKTRPEGSPLSSRLACITGTNQSSIKFYHEKG